MTMYRLFYPGIACLVKMIFHYFLFLDHCLSIVICIGYYHTISLHSLLYYILHT